VIISEFVSLDGVMQAPGHLDEDRDGGFEQGGWQVPYFDDVMGTAVDKGLRTGEGCCSVDVPTSTSPATGRPPPRIRSPS
jgi:hypothetical protein